MMNTQIHLINFIAFASASLSKTVKNSLLALGVNLQHCSASSWLENDSSNIENPAILLLAEDNYPRDKVLSKLKTETQQDCIIIMHKDQLNIPPEILLHCSEFLTWPCLDSELKLRLHRSYHSILTEDTDDDSADLIRILMHLNIIGRSPSFIRSMKLIQKYASCDAPVLISGETGTGKELAARAVHYIGTRKDGPFIPVNCGAIPDNLIENELFGHVKGAFTDARATQSGMVKMAERGTLFLDEIEALSPKSQISLLRFLQNNEYKPLGESQIQKADVRIVGATNVDLKTLAETGEFRKDLFFRLNILSLQLPPLRERRSDIRLLATFFIERYARQYDLPKKTFYDQTLLWMEQYNWPGNIRELESFVHRQFLLADGRYITSNIENEIPQGTSDKYELSHISFHDQSFHQAKTRVIMEFERCYLEWLMQETNGNVTLAAKKADKERRALGKLLKKHSIEKSFFSTEP